MGNRKQPFGYRVVMGEIALHPQESKLVEYIFQQYLAGATYNTLVEELREQSIPYDEGKLWNKNMVARILEDSRYTGERGYPPVIDREALEKALEKRSAKQTAAPKTDTQKLLRRFSGRPSTARMERQVLNLLNSLIVSPEQLRLPATAPPDRSTELNLQRELDRVMECRKGVDPVHRCGSVQRHRLPRIRNGSSAQSVFRASAHDCVGSRTASKFRVRHPLS